VSKKDGKNRIQFRDIGKSYCLSHKQQPILCSRTLRVNLLTWLGREKLVSRPLRLLGLGVSSLHEPNEQQLVLL
jgi:hypothetical protein